MIIDTTIGLTVVLITDQYGNYLIQHIMALMDLESNQKIIGHIIKDFLQLSKQKYASNVIEKVKL